MTLISVVGEMNEFSVLIAIGGKDICKRGAL